MGDEGMDPLLRVSSEAERFTIVTDEIERLVWRYVLSPLALQGIPGMPKIQEIGAVVEIMPNVYAHTVRLVLDKQPYHFIRIWGAVQHPDGSVEESPLLVARSDDFPDDALSQFRVGMNSNLLWYSEIKRTFLSALAARKKSHQLPADATEVREHETAPGLTLGVQRGVVSATEVRQLLARGDMAALTRFIERHAQPNLSALQTDTDGLRRGIPPSAAQTPLASSASSARQPSAAEASTLADLRRQTQGLFDEWKRLREAAYKERDTLDLKLKDLYFSLYPFMRDAARYTTAIDLDTALATWIREGCLPPKDEEPWALPPGVTVDVIPFDETRARQLAASSEEARRLAIEYERAKAQVWERSRILERICEIAGGHSPHTERDEAGTPRTVCDRCGARLNQRTTDPRDSWLE